MTQTSKKLPGTELLEFFPCHLYYMDEYKKFRVQNYWDFSRAIYIKWINTKPSGYRTIRYFSVQQLHGQIQKLPTTEFLESFRTNWMTKVSKKHPGTEFLESYRITS